MIFLILYFHQYKIKTLNLILPNVYGPGDYLDTTRSHALNGIITRMIENKNNNFNIWGTGKPKREWLYVGDISRIIKIVLNKKKFFKDFDHINVAQNQSFSINFIAKLVKKFLNYKAVFLRKKARFLLIKIKNIPCLKK